MSSQNNMDDFGLYRLDFPIFQKKPDLIYLDSAATAQKPKRVIEAMSSFLEERYATVHRAVYSLSQEATCEYHSVRKKIQAFLGAKSEKEIIFTRGTTASINLVARSFCKAFLKPGSTILISEIEHHSNLIPWQMVAAEYKLNLKAIPVDDLGNLNLMFLEEALIDGAKLVAIAHMSNSIGVIHPIKKIIDLAHKHGAYVSLDGAQGVAHINLNVAELDVDFYSFSAHKLYGPTGIGVLYGKESLLDRMEPMEGGGDMVDQVAMGKSIFSGLPRKFEAGTPMIVEAMGFGEALDYISSIGLEAIFHWENKLYNYAKEQLVKISGLRILGAPKESGPIISFVLDRVHPLDMGILLDSKGICVRTGHLCSQPTMHRFGISGTMRISFALYNTFEEVDYFINALQNALKVLR